MCFDPRRELRGSRLIDFLIERNGNGALAVYVRNLRLSLYTKAKSLLVEVR